MKVFWQYTLARTAILALAYAVVAFVFFVWPGIFVPSLMTNLVAVGIAAMIAAVVSLLVLDGMRDDLARHLEQRAEKLNSRLEQSRRAEDVD